MESVGRLSYFQHPMIVCILFLWVPRSPHSAWHTPMPFHSPPAHRNYIQNLINKSKFKHP